ncbi:hypothetical protein C9439_03480 [archaeon SCG-AAA382B04]|nr:hypothetical protein C9439_03480 [archaeon SCG-AAA382B04]
MNLKDLELTIYRDPATPELDEQELCRYVEGTTSINTITKESILERVDEAKVDVFSKRFAESRVRDIEEKNEGFEPNFGEKRFEKRLIEDSSKDVKGVLYDAKKLEKIYLLLLNEQERSKNHLPFVLTNRLIGTFGEDNRYHARVSLYGFPMILSSTGLVEAPAKPKQFYRKKRSNSLKTKEEIKEETEGDFIDYGENRITKAMKGYLLQGIFHYLSKGFFCENNGCRFYNAHWQQELINAQINKPEFCNKHKKEIKEIKKRFSD